MIITCSGCEHYNQEFDDCECEGNCITCIRNQCTKCKYYSVVKFGDDYNMKCAKNWYCDLEVKG